MKIRAAFPACVLLAASLSAGAYAQKIEGPTFEVASIKPAAPQEMGRVMIRMQGGPGTPDPSQINYTNVNLKQVITAAYGVKSYQIQAPPWFESERFDITAKIAPGTTEAQFKIMLQNLLAERFKVTLHHDSKEMPIYALTVAKGGVKMKESEDLPAPADGGPNAGGGFGGGRTAIGPPTLAKDGTPQLPKGGRGAMMSFGVGGKMRMSANRQTVAQLSDMLANQLGRPVVDQTGLTKPYDYTLEYVPDEGQRPMGGMVMMGPGGDHGGAGGPGGASAPETSGPTLFTAVQEQLGLKLEAKKGPLDLIVIDTAEKTPTEN